MRWSPVPSAGQAPINTWVFIPRMCSSPLSKGNPSSADSPKQSPTARMRPACSLTGPLLACGNSRSDRRRSRTTRGTRSRLVGPTSTSRNSRTGWRRARSVRGAHPRSRNYPHPFPLCKRQPSLPKPAAKPQTAKKEAGSVLGTESPVPRTSQLLVRKLPSSPY